MLAVLGATGRVGGTAARKLRAGGVPVRAVVRNLDKAKDLAQIGCEIGVAGYHDEHALTTALSGASTVLAICPMNPTAANAQKDHGQMIAAIAAGIRQAGPRAVVAISDYGAHRELPGSITSIFRELEQRLSSTAAAVTFVRSAEHMENWTRLVRAAGASGTMPLFYTPATRRFPLVSALDVGSVAAELLLTPAPQSGRRIVHVEGPSRYTTDDLLDAAGQATGRSVSPVHIPEQAWKQALTSAGLSESYAELVAGMYAASNAGWIDIEPDAGVVRTAPTTLVSAFAATLGRSSGAGP